MQPAAPTDASEDASASDAGPEPRADAAAAAGKTGGAGGVSGADAGRAVDAGGLPDAGDAGTDASADPEAELVPLPSGSREGDNVVNLVDAEAAAELDDFLRGTPLMHAVLRQRLLHGVNLYLKHYEEVHDFVYLFTDHEVPDATASGAFESLNREAAPGGGNDIEIALGGYRTTGRLRGMIGVLWRKDIGPPLAHEMLHYWAVQLDPSLGFGKGRDEYYDAHWGFTGVYGQLGGFDRATLKCETPAGAVPPDCTAGTGGRTRYVVKQFFVAGNTSVLYAPLELYLMGLAPRSEVPATFDALDQAAIVPNTFDQTSGTFVVEADGISQIAFADVIARHGEIEPLAEGDRHFSAAFVVISSEPASDEVMDDVAEWAAAFGNRGSSNAVASFETTTGGRATLDTRLGPRRKRAEPAPEPRVRFECDVLEQNCPRPELACYKLGPSFCALSGGVSEGQACDVQFACAAGLDCFSGPSDPNRYLCTPYCDPEDASSELACATLCPGMEQLYKDRDGNTLGAICLN